ncbi:hypothetical protein HYV80_01655 [Candidatus Woesearchaeota archaeon]|nr:hypothetical protein [Candidatus Woesearchaeota archaeon]
MIKSKKGLEGPTWKLLVLILAIVFIVATIVFWPAVAEAARSALKLMFDKYF